MSIQTDLLHYELKDLRKHTSTPYCMANEELAEEMYKRVIVEYPTAQLIRYGIYQCIVVTERAKRALIKHLSKRKKEHEQAIAEIDAALAAIQERKEEK